MAAWIFLGLCCVVAVLPREAGGVVGAYVAPVVFWLAFLFVVLGGFLGALLSLVRRDLLAAAACVLPAVLLGGFVILVFVTADWQ